MATNVTGLTNGACWYGLHFGCVNTTNDPNCTKCAERLAHAVNGVLYPSALVRAQSIDAASVDTRTTGGVGA